MKQELKQFEKDDLERAVNFGKVIIY